MMSVPNIVVLITYTCIGSKRISLACTIPYRLLLKNQLKIAYIANLSLFNLCLIPIWLVPRALKQGFQKSKTSGILGIAKHFQ
jgi:hypothetical protein